MVRPWTVAALACLACAPLDRRDGALILILEQVPDAVDTVEVRVRSGDRTFSDRLPRPEDDVVTDFSAVPVGPAKVDVSLFAQDEIIDARVAMDATIVEGEVVELKVNFEEGPAFTIVEPEDKPHLLRGGGFIPLLVEEDGANPIDLTVLANGDPIEVSPAGNREWVGEIDPALAGPILPGTVELVITACLKGAPDVCIEKRRDVLVTRSAWTEAVEEGTRGRPVYLSSDNAVLFADAAGDLHVLDADTAEPKIDPISAVDPVREDVAVRDGLAYLVTEVGNVQVIDVMAEALLETHQVDATTAPVAFGEETYVGAGEDLLVLGASVRTVVTLPRRMRAPPLVDGEGVVAGDILGNVLALDASEATLFSTNVGAPIFAPPVRHLGDIVVAAGDRVFRLDTAGGERAPPISLGQPIVHAPVPLASALAVAAGDRVFFLGAAGVEDSVRVPAPITGAPARWSDTEVVIGLRDGLVIVVGRSRVRPLSRVSGAAGAPLVLDLGPDDRRVAVIGSGGDFHMLEPEADF